MSPQLIPPAHRFRAPRRRESEGFFLTRKFSKPVRRGYRKTLGEKVTKMSSKLILLAEDNIVNQKVAARQLQKLGYRADVVANGKEAILALGRTPYDLVLMDCQMPEMDGYEATAIIRRTEELKHTLIVAMTAHAMEGDREKCLAAGMNDYISKPVKLDELLGVLNAQLGGESDAANDLEVSAPVDVVRMRDALGDEPIEFAEILELYLEGMKSNLSQMEAALAAGDGARIESLAHACSGTSGNCGMTAVLAPLRELELTAREGRLVDASLRFAQTKQEFARIEKFLNQNVRPPETYRRDPL